MVVLSYLQVLPALDAHTQGMSTVQLSLDLGLTVSDVAIGSTGITLPDGQVLAWELVQAIREQETSCFLVKGNTIEKIQRFSEELNRFYSLMPTASAPTLVNGGFPMHRIKGIDPNEDTRRKLKGIAPCRGRVLDTTTGLGYTTIAAAKTADQVITIERDPIVIEIARLNPWSSGLFDNARIQQVFGDASECIQQFEAASFHRIMHDPPTFQLAGELYSGTFYQQLFRVLKPGGRLSHYIGNPDSKTGHRVTQGVLRRLKEAGFDRVISQPEAFGVVAYKA
jgi:uncharacterized protein